jgi:hypothetical protein
LQNGQKRPDFAPSPFSPGTPCFNFLYFLFLFPKKIQKQIKNWMQSGNAQRCFEIPPVIFGDGPRAFSLTKIDTFTIKVRLFELPGTSISNSLQIESKTAKNRRGNKKYE